MHATSCTVPSVPVRASLLIFIALGAQSQPLPIIPELTRFKRMITVASTPGRSSNISNAVVVATIKAPPAKTGNEGKAKARPTDRFCFQQVLIFLMSLVWQRGGRVLRSERRRLHLTLERDALRSRDTLMLKCNLYTRPQRREPSTGETAYYFLISTYH